VRGSGTLLIVRLAGDDGVVARLRAELASSAWQVVEISADTSDNELETLASEHDATAAVRCDISRRLELWVASASPSSPGSLDIIDVAGAKRDPGVPVWRAMETLRARGLRFSDPAPEPAPPVAPRASEPPAVGELGRKSAREKERDAADRARLERSATARPRLAVQLGPAYIWSPGGLGGSANGAGAVRFDSGRWSVSALVFLPLVASRLTRAEGEAQISTVIAAAAADVTWAELKALRFSSGVGFGPSLTTMTTGIVRAGYVGSTEREWLPTGFVRSGARVRLGSSFALGGSVLLGATMPPVSVDFGDRRVATWGGPWLACVLSLETTLGF
jgi:hypothetical protein